MSFTVLARNPRLRPKQVQNDVGSSKGIRSRILFPRLERQEVRFGVLFSLDKVFRMFVVLQVSNADKFVAERLSCVLRLPNRKGCR